MKSILFALLFVTLVIVAVYYRDFFITPFHVSSEKTQSPAGCSLEDIGPRVTEIDNAIGQYTRSSKNVSGLSTEGGLQTDYKDHLGEAKLIRQDFFGETFKSQITYYLSNSKAFFISVTRSEYDRPIHIDPDPNIQSASTREFYLDQNEHLCAWNLDKKLQKNDTSTNKFVAFLISTLRDGEGNTPAP